ncbi:nSTAND1 domain-containing NTPase [Actinokineospora sp. HUAS TT18]|uniref:helix-turn-helix domain-containing protein n=1 Tax=Actinokineospora sp. HUAS TT18 TaxID=3447451 RepID=UPI003F51F6F9
MPRGERRLDGEDSALVRFAVDLRRLREKAGSPSYRELARRAHYSSTTLSDAASGRQLPTLAVALAYVRACEGAIDEWESRWREVAAELSADPVPADAVAPYVGLAALGPQDADRFHGRSTLLDDLADRVARGRFVAVVGASGVGKSSLLRAGLIARVRAEGRTAVLMTPGPRPMAGLTAKLDGLPADSLLVIDQFEELFTLCQDRDERVRFLEAIGQTRVVIGLRADFVAHCADHPELLSAMTDAQVMVGAMSTEELRHMVVAPATRLGYTVEDALVEAIVAEAAGRAAVLPLVSHALLETWRRRNGGVLTLADYRAAGGIRGALAQTAEACYSALSERRQCLARELFLRLTAFGEGTEDTKRRISRDELDTTDPDTTAVLATVADARLITLDESTVELTHDALITAWPRLHQWLAADRDGLRVHRKLTEATHTWQSLDQDPGVLYRGAQLTIAREWVAAGRVLNPAELAFLDAGIDLEARELRAAARRDRQLRFLTVGLVVLLLVAIGLTVVAFEQRGQAVEMRQTAISRQLATQAQTLADSQPGWRCS